MNTGMPRHSRLGAELTKRSGIFRALLRPDVRFHPRPSVNNRQDIDFSLQNFYFLIKIEAVYADTTNEG
jgi:hypothetical protein